MMKRIKAKEDLFKKLQDLDEKRLDLSEIKENDGSVLEPSAAGGNTEDDFVQDFLDSSTPKMRAGQSDDNFNAFQDCSVLGQIRI